MNLELYAATKAAVGVWTLFEMKLAGFPAVKKSVFWGVEPKEIFLAGIRDL